MHKIVTFLFFVSIIAAIVALFMPVTATPLFVLASFLFFVREFAVLVVRLLEVEKKVKNIYKMFDLEDDDIRNARVIKANAEDLPEELKKVLMDLAQGENKENSENSN